MSTFAHRLFKNSSQHKIIINEHTTSTSWLISTHAFDVHGLWLLIKYFDIGNRLFYFWKKHIWTYSSKIKVPQFPYCHYVSVYVCTLATANTVWANKLTFEPGSLHMIMSKHIFYFFEIFIFWEDMPLSSILMHTTGEKESNTCFDMWSIIIKGLVN